MAALARDEEPTFEDLLALLDQVPGRPDCSQGHDLQGRCGPNFAQSQIRIMGRT
jgi:hypothetical protein